MLTKGQLMASVDALFPRGEDPVREELEAMNMVLFTV